MLVFLFLVIGSIVFSTPLIWMISTALKPIEQTMSMPPTWLPYRYFADIDGKRTAIVPKLRIEEPSVAILHEKSAEATVVPESKVSNIQEKYKVLKEIPASQNTPWVSVALEKINGDENTAEEHYFPMKSIERTLCFRWSNFKEAVKAMKCFWMYLKNTLILCFFTVVGTVISSAFAAYGFSRIQWKGRDKLFLLALATMMIPFPVIMVPQYCLYRTFGLIGTPHPLWIGSFFAGAFNVFLLRQFFMTIPQSLSEAARIDGCSELQIFFRIILPMSKPALLVVALFQFMGTWNDFLGPLLFLTNQEDFTLALGLQFFQSQHGGTEWNYLMAASLLVVTPVIVLFLLTQKAFIEGISTTGIKG